MCEEAAKLRICECVPGCRLTGYAILENYIKTEFFEGILHNRRKFVAQTHCNFIAA